MKSGILPLISLITILGIFSGCSKDEDSRYKVVNPSERDPNNFLSSVDTLIRGNFILYNLNYITGLHYLKNLRKVYGKVEIDANKNLDGLNGLNQLSHMEGSLQISENELLASLEGFNGLKSVGGNVFISNNNGLTSLKGLNNTLSIEAIKILRSNISSLSGLVIMPYGFSGDIGIANCPELSDISCFEDTRIVEGKVIIRNNRSLLNLYDLSNIIEVEDYINLSDCETTNLDGFNSLRIIKGNFHIIDNINLISLDGIKKLTTVGGDLKISNNINLVDFCEMRNLFLMGYIGGSSNIYQNENNPTVEDIINGNCAQDTISNFSPNTN